jgi:hypothetical protein
MSKTTPLTPLPSPLEVVHDEVASAIDNATPTGAFEAGFRRLQALASEHPELELSIATALKNLTEELTTLAAAPGGGPRIAVRLRLLENEMRARVARPNIYTPTPQPKESAFGPAPKPRPLDGRSMGVNYPHLDSFGMPRAPKQG